jgi:hypothetical protein
MASKQKASSDSFSNILFSLIRQKTNPNKPFLPGQFNAWLLALLHFIITHVDQNMDLRSESLCECVCMLVRKKVSDKESNCV